MKDGTAWRARLYLTLKFPIGMATSTAAVTLYASAVFGLTFWAWRPFRDHTAIDTPLGNIAVFLGGAILLLLTPWFIRVLIAVDKRMVRTSMG